MAVLCWHYQCFSEIFCHFCAIFVLCSCSVASLCVPPELWSEICCHPTPEHAGICHPLLAGVPAALEEVSQVPDLCQPLAHPENSLCNARAVSLPLAVPCGRDVPVPLGRAAAQDHIPAGDTNSVLSGEANPSSGRIRAGKNPSWEYFWILFFAIAVGKPVRSAEPWQRGCCRSPRSVGMTRLRVSPAQGPRSCCKLVLAAINFYLSPDNC